MKKFTNAEQKLRIIDKGKRNLSISVFLLSLLLSFCNVINTFAQEKTVTGKVTSTATETPLPGVNVLIKGTTNGTVTNLDGEFSINVSPTDILQVSFLGYNTEELEVGAQTEINVTLIEDISELEEIIVIGYGTQRKKLVTGATAQVGSDEISQRNSLTALQAMQGQAAGVNITASSGQPGEGMNVIIRGRGTVADASPLYIVDGVPMDNIDFLSPSDIEAIDVLKDAASCAIYGSRGGNGVILVTTKGGVEGRTQITFDAYTGVQSLPGERKIELLNAEQYSQIMREQHIKSGGKASEFVDKYFDPANLPAYTSDGPADTDWLDEMFVDNAVTRNYVLGLSGGTEESVYSLSASYFNQEGIVGGGDLSFYERFTVRLNSEKRMYNGRLKVGEHLTYTYVNKNGVDVGGIYGNTLRGAFNVSPLLPMYDDEGNFFNTASNDLVDQNGKTYWNDAEANPYASMVYSANNTNSNQRLLAEIYADLSLTKNFSFRSSVGTDIYNEQKRGYTPIYTLSAFTFETYSKASQNLSHSMKLKNDNVLTYNLNRGVNKLTVMAGQSSEVFNGVWMHTENADVAFNDLEHAYIDNTTNSEFAKMTLEGAPNDKDVLLSFFGRVQYDFNEKYLFNASFRRDGSSKFAEGNRWDNYPSASAGWILSEEDFMQSTSNFLQFLKVRASWGQNGNNRAKAFQYIPPVRFTQATYPFGNVEAATPVGGYPYRLPFPDLVWETSEQTNIGFDAKTLNNHLSINFDWYNKTTKDWLIVAPVHATAGADAPYINGGNVTNKGVELALLYQNRFGDFDFSVSANGSYNQNNVTDIPTDDRIVHGASNTLYNNSKEFYRAEVGYPIGYFWGYETAGIFNTNGEVSSYTSSDGTVIQPKAEPGDLMYVDQNDDGKITDDDRVMIGDPNPDFMFGININLAYKFIDFAIGGNGVSGNQIIQNYRDYTNKFANYTTDIMGRWYNSKVPATMPRVTNENVNYSKVSDIFVKEGAYFRINNITVGLNIADLVDIPYLTELRVYGQVQNAYIFTKYNGMDPEVGFGYDNGDADKFSSGIDLGYYPRPRTYLIGVNIKF